MKLLLFLFFVANTWASENPIDFKREFELGLTHLNYNLDFPSEHDHAHPGVVVASLSKERPNYYKHWVRDAALTMGSLIELKLYRFYPELENKINSWIEFERQLQKKAMEGVGLGEPVFLIDGEIYPFEWGRPQNDGPATRALSMTYWLEHLEAQSPQKALELYRDVVSQDINYVLTHWNQTSVDLWEEIRGEHYFTRQMEYKALKKVLPWALKYSMIDYAKIMQQLPLIEKSFEQFYDEVNYLIRPTLAKSYSRLHTGTPLKTEHLDIAVLLARLYFEDNSSNLSQPILIATLSKIENRFKSIYPINQYYNQLPPALGRYPEDIYDGVGFSEGHPWFLATLAAAEYYCRLESKNPAMLQRGIGFLKRALFHTDSSRNLSEQFNRHTGFQRGARDLTWSYTALLRALYYCGQDSLSFNSLEN